MKRRKFLANGLKSGAFLSFLPFVKSGTAGSSDEEWLYKRKLGKTGEMLSIIGFGGIVVRDLEQARANEVVSRAFEQGINYYDVAPSYGNAEEILGPALKPFRKKSFLACKTLERKKSAAEKELHASLKKLRTDYFDLYQLHALSEKADVETAFAPGGAMELFVRAKEEGKVRYLGFSAHSQEAALMAMESYQFDTILFPINFVCWHQGQFGPKAVQKAKEKEMGILALKTHALTRIPEGEEEPYDRLWYQPIEEKEIARMSLSFTLDQGATSAIPPGDARFFWRALELAQKIKPLKDEENKKLKQIAAEVSPLFSAG